MSLTSDHKANTTDMDSCFDNLAMDGGFTGQSLITISITPLAYC